MNEKELNRLLERYYSGESTREEEIALRAFFSGENVPEGFEAEKELFGYYMEMEEIPEPSAEFGERILSGIDRAQMRRSILLKRYLYPMSGIAAALLVMAGSYFLINTRSTIKDTYSDPGIAYQETRKILYQVSAKMNRATLALEPVGKMSKAAGPSLSRISRSAGIVEKNLKNLDYLKEASSKN